MSGVPQGTVLVPLLFSLNINDITADVEAVGNREIKDKEDTLKLQREINRLGNWAKEMDNELSTSQMQHGKNKLKNCNNYI